MSGIAGSTNAGSRLARFDRNRLLPVADGLAVAVAVSLPWSTSATEILVWAWFVGAHPHARPGCAAARAADAGRRSAGAAVCAGAVRDALGVRRAVQGAARRLERLLQAAVHSALHPAFPPLASAPAG